MPNLANAGQRINVKAVCENNGFHEYTLNTMETIPCALSLLLEVSIAWGGGLVVDSVTSLRSSVRVMAITDHFTMTGEPVDMSVLIDSANLYLKSRKEPFVVIHELKARAAEADISIDNDALNKIIGSQSAPRFRRALIYMLMCGIIDPLDLYAGIEFVRTDKVNIPHDFFTLLELALETPETSLRELIALVTS